MDMDLPVTPNIGLPTVLNSLLTQLLSTSEIKGWSIYENSGGNSAGLVNLNIRFSPLVSNSDPAIVIDMPAAYRKLGHKQMERSRARALSYKNTPPQTRSKSKQHNQAVDIVDTSETERNTNQDISQANISVESIDDDIIPSYSMGTPKIGDNQNTSTSSSLLCSTPQVGDMYESKHSNEECGVQTENFSTVEQCIQTEHYTKSYV